MCTIILSNAMNIPIDLQFADVVDVYHTDQLRKISPRGIHFDLKEGHLEGHIALSKVNLQKKKKKKKKKKKVIGFLFLQGTTT